MTVPASDAQSARGTRPAPGGGLADLFAAHRTAPWIFVSPGGNWGDELIYLGAGKMARDAGIAPLHADFRTFPGMATTERPFIYLHGGGGLNSWGSGRAFDMLEQAVAVPGATVIQGPQTCEVDNATVAARFARVMDAARCASVTVFARERTSWRFMDAHLPSSVALGLDHDTALGLAHRDILDAIGASKPPRRRYDLVISRKDDEMPSCGSIAGGAALTLDPALYADTFAHWVRIHLCARSITTNRLHSAIVGAIAGIPVTLLPGSYHKNRSLWEYSLQQMGVRWADEAPPSTRRGVDLMALLPAFLRRSWKVRRLAMRLKGMPGA